MKYLKNVSDTEADFYVYGDIVDERSRDWYTGEMSETEVDALTLKEELNEVKDGSNLNIYINSAGGSVFAASTMVSMLKRMKNEKGVKIHAYIDGLCASASTYLAMASDDINVYSNSIMMIHKPMCVSFGNADDLAKDIATLDTIENDVMIPLYMAKAKDGITEDEIKDMLASETWFSGNKDDDLYIGNYFGVNLIDEPRKMVASASKLFKNYKHTPIQFLQTAETTEAKINVPNEEVVEPTNGIIEESVEEEVKEEPIEIVEPIDYSIYEEIIKSLKEIS